MTSKAHAKFKRPLKRKVATAIKTNVMVAEQLLLANAKARLQLGREAVLIQHYLTHSKLTFFLRVVSWLSFIWGAYGVWVILRTGSPLFNDDVCYRIGFFTVSIKFWVTQYFTYLMLSVLQLVCNTMYIAARQCKIGEKIARRFAKRKDSAHGLPVPLYELVLDHWILHEQADAQTLTKLATKNAEDESAFLAAKQKRLEQELQEVGNQLQRCSSALGQDISSPTLSGADRRRTRALVVSEGGARAVSSSTTPRTEYAASPRPDGSSERNDADTHGSAVVSDTSTEIGAGQARQMHASVDSEVDCMPGPEPDPEPEGQEEAEPPWATGCSPKTSDAVQRNGAPEGFH